MGTLWKVLTRRKLVETVSTEDTRLNRVLNTFDLTALGVGGTLGVGVYVLSGQVAKDTAGPSVILSFLIAALASVIAGLCYAEFGARVPKAGSAYIYSYVCVGEFVAFVIGWNLILEYVIGAASVGKGLSLYLDRMLNNTMKNAFIDVAPINLNYMSTYFDFFSFGVSMLLSVALAFGMKESTMANNIFTTLNIGVVLFVVIAGSFHVDIKNWEVPSNSTVPAIGKGGFFPFGVEGMIKGAAKCFYGFVGFDCIATAGEEVRNPRRAIPISIILSLAIIFLAYFGTSAITTLMVPYYEQDKDTPLPHAFERVGWEWAKWVVAVGGVFGLVASLFGAMFPLPRIIFAMSSDGLVFRFLAKVHPKFQTPVIGTLLAGLLTGLMAAMFDLDQLVSMMSIGTLLAYTLVAASVLLLRYANDKITETKRYIRVRTSSSDTDDSQNSDNDNLYSDNRKYSVNNDEEQTASDSNHLLSNESTNSTVISQIFNFSRQSRPSKLSENLVSTEVFIYCVLCVLVGSCATYMNKNIINGEIWAIVLTSIAVAFTLVILVSLTMQPTSRHTLSFQVPWVPLVPALSILVNIYLMLMLDTPTWIRFGVWMALGVPMYYYCVRHSSAETVNSYSKNNSLSGRQNLAFDITSNGTMKNGTKPSGDIERQQEAVMAQLDEILEEEAVKISRKLSDVSLVSSGVVSREENVVADVHRDSCDDVSTPTSVVAPPIPAYSPVGNGDASVKRSEAADIFYGDGSVKHSDVSDSYSDASVRNSDASVRHTDASVRHSDPSVRHSDASARHSDASVINSDESARSSDASVKTSENVQNVAQKIQADYDKIEVFDGEKVEPQTIEKRENDVEAEETVEYEEIPVRNLEEKPIITSNIEETLPRSPLPPPLPTPDYLDAPSDVFNIPRPTVTNLKSVKLKKIERSEDNTVEKEELPDVNIKVNSEESKAFLDRLNAKLQKMPGLIQSYIPYIGSKANEEKIEEGKPNENVVEEHIDTEKAKEKFEEYVGQRLENAHPSFQELKNHKNGTKTPTLVDKWEDGDDGFSEHQKKMSKVFLSMNLKKVDSMKELKEENKWQSWGSRINPNEDKVVHKQKMQDIFKSIQLLRKDSSQVENDQKTV